MRERKGVVVLLLTMIAVLVLAFFISKQGNSPRAPYYHSIGAVNSADREAQNPQKSEEKVDFLELKIFFARRDYKGDCNSVDEYSRTVKTTASGKAAASLSELLKGPTSEESLTSFNAIPIGAKLLSLEVSKNGLAKADLSRGAKNYSPGNCTLAAVYAQINKTLKQFTEIKSIFITVEGLPLEEAVKKE